MKNARHPVATAAIEGDGGIIAQTGSPGARGHDHPEKIRRAAWPQVTWRTRWQRQAAGKLTINYTKSDNM